MSLRQVQIIHGDDLYHIAQRETGDADRWWTLAIFNDLDHPYINTDVTAKDRDASGKNFLVIGDVLFIPEDLASDQVVDRQFAVPEDDYFDITLKRDIELGRDGDLAINDANGDFRTVSGIDNLVFALQHRLAIFRGEMAYHPDYGSKIHELPGGVADLRLFAQARVETVQTIRQDPRIESVGQVTITQESDLLDIRAEFVVQGQRGNDATSTNFRVNR